MSAKRLSEDTVYEIIVELYAKEKTIRDISLDLGISQRVIGRINMGERYKMDYYKYPIRTHKESIRLRERENLNKKQGKQSGDTS